MSNLNRHSGILIEAVSQLVIPRRAVEEYLEAHSYGMPEAIYPEIRALTADKGTMNDTIYPAKSLRGNPEEGTGVISFNRPYPIPIIKDHNTGGGLFGGEASDVYGRVFKPAQFVTVQGEGYLRVMPTITHPEAIEGILSGRWLTNSLGSRTDSVQCTICGQELTKEFCDHAKGQMYETDGKAERARWRIGPIKAKELSFVLTPSDDQAGVLHPNIGAREESAQPLSRLLVHDGRGIFDLLTGDQIEEDRWMASQRRVFGIRSLPVLVEESRPMEEQTGFVGPGEYRLIGSGHEHVARLDAEGDGRSSPGTMDGHRHNIKDGTVQASKLYKDDHTHQIEPATARKKEQAEDGEDTPVTLGDLYRLDPSDADYAKSDDAKDESTTEAVLTTKGRKALSGSAFCGPERSFPAHDKAHVRAGLAYLDRSNLTSAQKSRVRACLVRKGKSYGMDMGGDKESAMTHAAKLVDADHKVEMDLYPMPVDLEGITEVLGQIQAMPHTPEEREQITRRVAAHCKSFMEAADWQKSFGALAEVEAGDPIAIAITSENYALVWSALQICGTAFGEAGCKECQETRVPETPTDPPTETETPAPAEEPAAPPAAAASEAADALRDLAAQVAALKQPTAPDETATQIEALQGQLQGYEAKLVEALAHSVALYLRQLRKPQARGKKQEELVELLKGRGIDYLTYTLQDLSAEVEEGTPLAPIAQLPKLADPTESGADPAETFRSETEEPPAATGDEPPTSGIRLSPLEELTEDDEEEDIITLHALWNKERQKASTR